MSLFSIALANVLVSLRVIDLWERATVRFVLPELLIFFLTRRNTLEN